MTGDPTGDVGVRAAAVADLPNVLGVLDAAALETDAARARTALDRGDVLVAVRDGGDGDADPPILGALVLDGVEIDAVAVRRRRRGQGIGSALVAAAAARVRSDPARRDRLVAAFDAGVWPFYASLGFEIRPLGDGERYVGRLDARES